MLEVKSGDLVVAVFDPRRMVDLKPSALAVVGWKGEFEALWMLEEGEYRGE